MMRIPAPVAAVARSPRLGLTLAVTALATLSLASCGTATTGAGGSQVRPAGAVTARPADTPSRPDPWPAFLDMLEAVGQPCRPDAPSDEEPVPAGEKPPSAPVELLPVGSVPPSGSPPPSPGATPREVALNALQKCEGRLHAARVTKALSGPEELTTAQVRKALTDLGYLDERIHRLERSGATTHFYLDLRVLGGSLCLEGTVTGTKAVVEAYGAPEDGPFTPVKRNR
ncbi:hypothetical protein OG349_14715 [Streptomyces sp. NBC_01317]|uniref:hypothetical protein n=1 Tax=Streptomyces sp. NBC_01317 TaxID=2903822 RepID=UPI002E0F37CD|nr:hypothetical protein OG349_14715 [Streptomyces sp. NBC_01317]